MRDVTRDAPCLALYFQILLFSINGPRNVVPRDHHHSTLGSYRYEFLHLCIIHIVACLIGTDEIRTWSSVLFASKLNAIIVLDSYKVKNARCRRKSCCINGASTMLGL